MQTIFRRMNLPLHVNRVVRCALQLKCISRVVYAPIIGVKKNPRTQPPFASNNIMPYLGVEEDLGPQKPFVTHIYSELPRPFPPSIHPPPPMPVIPKRSNSGSCEDLGFYEPKGALFLFPRNLKFSK